VVVQVIAIVVVVLVAGTVRILANVIGAKVLVNACTAITPVSAQIAGDIKTVASAAVLACR
jgi:hypothetical protein